jgi:hypothetical protein
VQRHGINKRLGEGLKIVTCGECGTSGIGVYLSTRGEAAALHRVGYSGDRAGKMWRGGVIYCALLVLLSIHWFFQVQRVGEAIAKKLFFPESGFFC